MTDSLSMINHLSQGIEARVAAGERDLAMLKAGRISIQAHEDDGQRNVTADWITRVEEWLAADRAHLGRLPAGG